jgi:hypothetical protein
MSSLSFAVILGDDEKIVGNFEAVEEVHDLKLTSGIGGSSVLV